MKKLSRKAASALFGFCIFSTISPAVAGEIVYNDGKSEILSRVTVRGVINRNSSGELSIQPSDGPPILLKGNYFNAPFRCDAVLEHTLVDVSGDLHTLPDGQYFDMRRSGLIVVPEKDGSFRLKCFQGYAGEYAVSRCSHNVEFIKKQARLLRESKTIAYWLKAVSSRSNERCRVAYRDNPVNVDVCFDGNNDVGRVTILPGTSNEAAVAVRAALLQRLPIAFPPNKKPYENGLRLRFDSHGFTVKLKTSKSKF